MREGDVPGDLSGGIDGTSPTANDEYLATLHYSTMTGTLDIHSNDVQNSVGTLDLVHPKPGSALDPRRFAVRTVDSTRNNSILSPPIEIHPRRVWAIMKLRSSVGSSGATRSDIYEITWNSYPTGGDNYSQRGELKPGRALHELLTPRVHPRNASTTPEDAQDAIRDEYPS
ncbi:hypothetical protein B0J17DRAFT_706187 [Rhizoctonia solani]|nr:hypothetical protein B0J17DRAFT_706187 [Rhizoctonia solani]